MAGAAEKKTKATKRSAADASLSANTASRSETRKSHAALTLNKTRNLSYQPLLSSTLSRSSKFLTSLPFVNDLPRPTLGPVFLEGTNESLTEWGGKVDRDHVWKLHAEPGCGVIIEAVDPLVYSSIAGDGTGDMEEGDREIVDWRGSMGDEEGDKRRQRQVGGAVRATKTASSANGPAVVLKNRSVHGGSSTRVIAEEKPFFMRATTYMVASTNKRVHSFKNLNETRKEESRIMDEEIRKRQDDRSSSAVVKSFEQARKDINMLRHPTDPKLTAVRTWEVLPLVDTWATPYVHATIPVKEEGDRTEDLTQAVITDVEKKKQAGNEGTLACNVIVPEGDEGEYVGYQSYDLEVVPLKEEGSDTNFVIVMDDTNKRAMYHPLTSRVVLTTGRQTEADGVSKDITRTIVQRDMSEEEASQFKMVQGELDRDLCEREGWL